MPRYATTRSRTFCTLYSLRTRAVSSSKQRSSCSPLLVPRLRVTLAFTLVLVLQSEPLHTGHHWPGLSRAAIKHERPRYTFHAEGARKKGSVKQRKAFNSEQHILGRVSIPSPCLCLARSYRNGPGRKSSSNLFARARISFHRPRRPGEHSHP